MDPATILVRHNTLCAQYKSVFTGIKFFECKFNLFSRKFLRGFNSPRGKYFISMMVTMIMPAATVLIMMMVVLRIDADEEGIKRMGLAARYLGRLLFMAVIAIIQALGIYLQTPHYQQMIYTT